MQTQLTAEEIENRIKNLVSNPSESIGEKKPEKILSDDVFCNEENYCALSSISGNGCKRKDLMHECIVWKSFTKKKLNSNGIFERFHECNFFAIDTRGVPEKLASQYAEVKNYAENLRQNLIDGMGLILRGPVGTLKTSFAVAVGQEALIKFGYSIKFISMSSLLDTIFTLKARNQNEWTDFENLIRTVDLLIVDDLGAEYSEGWVLTKVDAIFSERYNRKLSTIITTNLTSEELKKTYSSRILDRIRSTSKIINFEGPSQRERP